MARKRWMQSVLKAAAETKVVMPWDRAQRAKARLSRTRSAKTRLAGA